VVVTSGWDAPSTRRAVLVAAGAGFLAACTRSAHRPSAARAPSSSPAPSTPIPAPVTSPAATHVVRVAHTGRPEVALTFHGSGDTSQAVALLQEVERAGAAVTVFAVGTWLEQHPEMAGRVLRGGHALGNHTYTHPTLHRLSTADIHAEVFRCAAVLRRLTGSPGVGFRPSGGSAVTGPMVAAAAAAGYSLVVGYDVDSTDNTDPGAGMIVERVLAGVRAGSIVSLHLGHPGTVRAIPEILSRLQARHLRAVTVPRLLAG
jgi:peptidoglycan/xylan/chitin deacetylase (PgdA/CDA1 family)